MYSLVSAYTIRIRRGYEYKVQFARLRFYPTSSLCFRNANFVVHFPCMNINYNRVHSKSLIGSKIKVISIKTFVYRLVA